MSFLVNPYSLGASIPADDFATPSDLSLQFGSPIDESGSPLATILTNKATRNTATKKFGAASLLTDPTNESAIQLASNVDFGSANFTIEGWFALSGEPSSKQIAGRWGSSGNRAWNLSYDASSNQIRFACSSDGAATVGTASYDFDTDGISLATFFDGAFHHVAVVRNGSTITVYVDGDPGAATISIGSAIIYNGGTNYTFLGGAAVTAAQTIASTWPGYIDELRISTLARYTSSFTPPSVAFGRNSTDDPDFSTVEALIGMNDNFGVTQSGVVTNPLVLVNYGIANTGPFDAYGLRGRATYTYPYVASDAHFGFGSGDFTIELFGMRSAEATAWGSTLRQLAGCWSTVAGQRSWRIILSTSTTFQFEYSLDGSTTAATVTFTGIAPVADTDYNLAVVRSGGNLYLYCNGTRVATASISGSIFDPNSISLPLGILCGMTVALASQNSCATTTRIHAIRTLKGTARFIGASYAVPSFPLP